MGFDFLSEELRAQFNIVDTEAVSSNGYDENAMAIIDATENRGSWFGFDRVRTAVTGPNSCGIRMRTRT